VTHTRTLRLITACVIGAMILAGCSGTTTPAPTSTPPLDVTTTAVTQESVSHESEPAESETSGVLLERAVIGRSVQDRPIVLWHRTDVAGAMAASDDPDRVVVLVIGSIHGNEPAGLDIVDVLAQMPAADINAVGVIDVWLMPTGNPDGIAAGTRHNARQVDLNRNFPFGWAPLQQPGDYEYAGTGPASEPETRAMIDVISWLQPDLTVWYHQDVYRVPPSTGKDRAARELYAQLTGLPLLAVEGGTYTGVAATWHRRTLDAVSFIVELGPTLSADEARMHANAVLATATASPM
jgi:murein peptide amidase A